MARFSDVNYVKDGKAVQNAPYVRERLESDMLAMSINTLRANAGYPPHNAEEMLLNRIEAHQQKIEETAKILKRYETDQQILHSKLETQKKEQAGPTDIRYTEREIEGIRSDIMKFKESLETAEADKATKEKALKDLRAWYKAHPVPLHLQYPPNVLPEEERVDSSMLDPSLWQS